MGPDSWTCIVLKKIQHIFKFFYLKGHFAVLDNKRTHRILISTIFIFLFIEENKLSLKLKKVAGSAKHNQSKAV